MKNIMPALSAGDSRTYPRVASSIATKAQLNHGTTSSQRTGTGIVQTKPRRQQKIAGTQIQWINSLVWFW
jgi:hypothetical protein